MRIETVKVYKGKSDVTINNTEADLKEWNDRGYITSSQRQKKAPAKETKEIKTDEEKAE